MATSGPACSQPQSRRPGGGSCYAFGVSKATGKQVWRVKTGVAGAGGFGGVYLQAKNGKNGLFVAGTWNQNVTAYAAQTGDVVWSVDVGASIESHPAYHAGVLFVSAEDAQAMFALNASTGQVVWQYRGAAAELNSSPSVSFDTVFVGFNDHYLHAVSRTTGEFKFKFQTCQNIFSSAAIASDGTVLIGCNTETVRGDS